MFQLRSNRGWFFGDKPRSRFINCFRWRKVVFVSSLEIPMNATLPETLPELWQQTRLTELGKGWYKLSGIPPKSLGSTIAKLFELEAKRISIPDPSTVQFSVSANSELVRRLKAKFPTTE
jgi:hypothetical protein